MTVGERVSVVAYACIPGGGSEPGAGGALVLAAARVVRERLGTLTVWTREKHRGVVQESLEQVLPANRFRIETVGARIPLLRDGSRLHSVMWQSLVYLRLRGWGRNGEDDIVHHVTFASDVLPAAVHGNFNKGTRTVWGPVGGSDARMVFGKSMRWRLLRACKRTWVRLLSSRVDLTVCQSDYVRDLMASPMKQIVVEPNCALNFETRGGQIKDRKLTPVVLCVGVLTKNKKVDLAIAAARASHGIWKLKIVGDGPERHALETLAQDLVDRGIVEFYGRIEREKVLDLLQRARGLIHCAEHEGAPWAVAEALSAGCWVIARQGTGADYLVRQVEGGGIIVPSDVERVPVWVSAAIEEQLSKQLEPVDALSRFSSDRLPALLEEWYFGELGDVGKS